MTKKTKSEGKTLEEANNINKSLMVLGNCDDCNKWDQLTTKHAISVSFEMLKGELCSIWGHGDDGQMVSMLAFFSDNPNSNPDRV